MFTVFKLPKHNRLLQLTKRVYSGLLKGGIFLFPMLFLYLTFLHPGSFAQDGGHRLNQGLNSLNSGWQDSIFGYYAQESNIRDILLDFSASTGVPLRMGDGVRGKVSSSFPTGKSKDFLNELGLLYDFTWFYDGSTIYINSVSEVRQETLNLDVSNLDHIEDGLEVLGIDGTQYGWRMLPTQNILQVVGPPRFLALVEELALGIDGSGSVIGNLPEAHGYAINFFRLKYAYTHDSIAGTQGHIMGIANILGRIMNVSNISTTEKGPSHATASPKRRNSIGGLHGTGLGTSPGSMQPQDSHAPSGQQQPHGHSRQLVSGSDFAPRPGSFIVADERLNALIIRDRRTNMPIYDKLIRKLDRPVDQIEINIIILDINENSVDELGVSWDINEIWRKSVSNNLSDNVFFSDFSSPAVNVSPARFAGITNLSGTFFAQLSFLARDHDARIIGQPSVITFDNHEAVFENITTFYVQLSGTATNAGQAVDLIPVHFGTRVKVTPHIIGNRKEQRKIQLDIRIEDGNNAGTSQAGSQYNTIQTQNSTLDTQASVEEGKSLLLGGYRLDQLTKASSGLPFFRNLPIVGILFSQEYDASVSAVRYFVITPSVIETELTYNGNIEQILRNAQQRTEHIIDKVEKNINPPKPLDAVDIQSLRLPNDQRRASAMEGYATGGIKQHLVGLSSTQNMK